MSSTTVSDRILIVSTPVGPFYPPFRAATMVFSETLSPFFILLPWLWLQTTRVAWTGFIIAVVLTLIVRWRLVFIAAEPDAQAPVDDRFDSRTGNPIESYFGVLSAAATAVASAWLAGILITRLFTLAFNFQVTRFTVLGLPLVIALTLLVMTWRMRVRGREPDPVRRQWVAITGFVTLVVYLVADLFGTAFISSLVNVQHLPLGSYDPLKQPLYAALIAFVSGAVLLASNRRLPLLHRWLQAPKRWTFLLSNAYLTVIAFGIAATFLLVRFLDHTPPGVPQNNPIHIVNYLLLMPLASALIYFLVSAIDRCIETGESDLIALSDSNVLPFQFKRQHPRFGTNSILLLTMMVVQVAILLLFLDRFDQLLSMIVMTLALNELVLPQTRRFFRYRTENGLPIEDAIITALLIAVGTVIAVAAGSLLISQWRLLLLMATFAVVLRYRHYHVRLTAEDDGSGEVLSRFRLEKIAMFDDAAEKASAGAKVILVAARHPQGLHHLQHVLQEPSAGAASVIVMTVQISRTEEPGTTAQFGRHERVLFREVFRVADQAGKSVTPIVVSAMNSWEAIVVTASRVGADEIVLGLSGKVKIDEQVKEFIRYWNQFSELKPDQKIKLRILTPKSTYERELTAAVLPKTT